MNVQENMVAKCEIVSRDSMNVQENIMAICEIFSCDSINVQEHIMARLSKRRLQTFHMVLNDLRFAS